MAAMGPSGPGPSGNCGRGGGAGSVGLGLPDPQRGHRLPQPPPWNPPLTLALPAPGPMGFMIVYMLSLELESGGDTGA